ncbi:unnamed protein product, partial [Angiostrongylus costaricensis]|uniref:MFS domain-containing protein n=1 Tax=Angiostrongylus costaricensis TaxID=334426 RepID=A0A158PDG4_ANGCS
ICWIVENNSHSLYGKCGSAQGTKLAINFRIKDPDFSTTLIKEFGISCSSFFWKEAGLTAFTIGAVFAVPVMSALADEYGRRPITLAAMTASDLLYFRLIAHVLASFSPNYYIFVLLRLIIGAASDVSFFLSEEFFSQVRAWITLVLTIAWVFGMFWVGLLSLVINEWRTMYFACAAPGILYLPESPHFLIQHAKYKEIEEYIKISNRLAMSLYYYGLSLISVDLSEDRFTSFMLSAFVEIPGGLAVLPLMLYAGRRNVCLISMVVQGVAIAIAPFVRVLMSSFEYLQVIYEHSSHITYTVHPIYVSEMAPTSVRSLFYSLINGPQSLGMIVAPYLRHTVCLTQNILHLNRGLCVFLPETKNRPMPSDIKSLTTSGACTFDNRDREELMRSVKAEMLNIASSQERRYREFTEIL